MKEIKTTSYHGCEIVILQHDDNSFSALVMASELDPCYSEDERLFEKFDGESIEVCEAKAKEYAKNEAEFPSYMKDVVRRFSKEIDHIAGMITGMGALGMHICHDKELLSKVEPPLYEVQRELEQAIKDKFKELHELTSGF